MKLKPKDVKRYNKIADKGRKPIMVRVGSKWYTWYEGNSRYKSAFLTTKSGRDVEFDFKQIDDIQESVEKLKEKVVKLADGSYDVKKAKFKLLQRVSKRGLEGIVFLGAGGKLNQWVKGINDLWNKEKIGKGLIEDKMMGLYVINTTGGRTDLVMIFKTKSQLDIGKLAMWRLKFGDASWLSDYVVNYRDQHESIEEGVMKLTKSKLKEIIKEVISEGNKLRDFIADGDTVVTYRDETDFQMAYAQDVYNKVIGSLKTGWLPFYFDGTSVVNSRDDDVDVKGLSNVKWGKITYKQLKDAIAKKLPPKKYPMKKPEW